MSNIIIDALNYFFKKREDFQTIQNISFNDEITDLMPTVTINDKLMKFNLIGSVNMRTKTFTWAWHINLHKRNCIKTKQLLIYAVNKDIITLNDAYIKRVLTTSVINEVNNNILIMIISLSLYLTKANSIFSTELFKDEIINFYGLYSIDNND